VVYSAERNRRVKGNCVAVQKHSRPTESAARCGWQSCKSITTKCSAIDKGFLRSWGVECHCGLFHFIDDRSELIETDTRDSLFHIRASEKSEFILSNVTDRAHAATLARSGPASRPAAGKPAASAADNYEGGTSHSGTSSRGAHLTESAIWRTATEIRSAFRDAAATQCLPGTTRPSVDTA
jgi:hypothetical protein